MLPHNLIISRVLPLSQSGEVKGVKNKNLIPIEMRFYIHIVQPIIMNRRHHHGSNRNVWYHHSY